MLCLILSILLSLKKFLYCWFILHIKHILSYETPGVPPGKTDGLMVFHDTPCVPPDLEGLDNVPSSFIDERSKDLFF